MSTPTMRGVQPHDVEATADALIAEGLRPTIERVRLKIGRGSPNTIAPMLDAWFAKLGSRLGVVPSETNSAEKIPPNVQQAVEALWQQARGEASEVARLAFEQQIESLRQERVAFDIEQSNWIAHTEQREQQQLLQQRTLDHLSVELAQSHQSTLFWKEKAEDLESQLSASRLALGAATEERHKEHRQHGEQLQSLLNEHKRQAQQAQTEHKRLLALVDQMRQTNIRLEKQFAKLQSEHETTLNKSEKARHVVDLQLQKLQLEHVALRAREQSQSEHLAALQLQIGRLSAPRVSRAKKNPQPSRAKKLTS